jgi:predicted dehydrogenase
MARKRSTLSRRGFLQTLSAASLVPLLPSVARAAFVPRRARRRYAIVGTGGRGSSMWGSDLVKRWGDAVELVGLCDINPKRVQVAKKWIGVDCPTFTDFDAMCDRVKPELLVVTTVDCFHAGYIARAFERGIDVITEKPMVTEAAQCTEVLAAEKKSGRRLTVAFNYRYAPKHQQIKELLLDGAIGKILSVDFSWYLDIHHGADYFRRWHRLRAKSGSLLVHKASHHFDLMNWWVGSDPVEVTAYGDLKFYGKNGPFRHTHCRPCPHKERCQFYWDMTKDAGSMELYAQCESEDGYLRDGCVFREDIDIFDTMSLSGRYANGVNFAYSLNAFMPFEGYRIAFNGSLGRLEVRDYERQPWNVPSPTEIHVTKNFGQREEIAVRTASGGHGGGDDILRDLIFHQPEVKEHLRLPGSHEGACACLLGIGARTSILEKRPYTIQV